MGHYKEHFERRLAVGDICRTNLSKPGGLVKILEITTHSEVRPGKRFCWIEHIEDHPYGYAKGTRGGYYEDELIFIEAE